MAGIKSEEVKERLTFAEKRLKDLLELNKGDFAGAVPSERQQLIQEFFFHLVGAVETLAQFVNEDSGNLLDSEDVTVRKVSKKLPTTDQRHNTLNELYAHTKHKPLPSDPYSDEGYIFRIYNYRHQVTHRRRNPFHFRVGSDPPVSLFLDPRDTTADRIPSEYSLQEDAQHMIRLIGAKIKAVLDSSENRR